MRPYRGSQPHRMVGLWPSRVSASGEVVARRGSGMEFTSAANETGSPTARRESKRVGASLGRCSCFGTDADQPTRGAKHFGIGWITLRYEFPPDAASRLSKCDEAACELRDASSVVSTRRSWPSGVLEVHYRFGPSHCDGNQQHDARSAFARACRLAGLTIDESAAVTEVVVDFGLHPMPCPRAAGPVVRSSEPEEPGR